MKSLFALGLLSVILWPFTTTAQVPTGTPPFGSFGGGPFDIVNLGNLNAHFAISVVQKAGRGAPFTYTLAYDTSVWYPVGSSGSQTWQFVPKYGWNFPTATGFLTNQIVTSWTQPCDPQHNNFTPVYVEIYGLWVYHDPNGGSHPITLSTSNYTLGSACPAVSAPPPTGSGVASDGSGYTVNASYRSGTIAKPDGTILDPTASTRTDSNGNQTTVSTSGVFTDTLGQTVLSMIGTNPLQLSYTAPNGSLATYNVNYTSYNIKTNFGCSGIAEYTANGILLVSSVSLPDGSSYGFTYEPTPGNSGFVTARLQQVTLPTGGSISYAYPGSNDGIVCADGSTIGLTRTLSPGGTWTYARNDLSGAHWQTTVTSPPDPANSGSASDVTVIDFQRDGNSTNPTQNFYETQRKVYQGPTSGALLSTYTTCYNANYANCVTTGVSSPISQRDLYAQLPNGKTRLTELTYSANNTIYFSTDQKEYDYGVSLGSAPSSSYLIRERNVGTFTFNNTGLNNVIVRPASVTVTDWSSGTPKTLSSTSYTYDQTTTTATSGTPQHTGVGGSSWRGNLTSVATQANGSTTLYQTFTYYDTGTLNTSTGPSTSSTSPGPTTTYLYSSATNGNSTASCGNSFPTTINEPMSLSRSITWSCIGGVMLTSTDENGKTTTVDENGIDQNSNSGECGANGGYWVDGTVTSITTNANNNDVYLTGNLNGVSTDAYIFGVSAPAPDGPAIIFTQTGPTTWSFQSPVSFQQTVDTFKSNGFRENPEDHLDHYHPSQLDLRDNLPRCSAHIDLNPSSGTTTTGTVHIDTYNPWYGSSDFEGSAGAWIGPAVLHAYADQFHFNPASQACVPQ